MLDFEFLYPFVDTIFYCSFKCFPLSFGFSGTIRSNGQNRSRHVTTTNQMRFLLVRSMWLLWQPILCHGWAARTTTTRVDRANSRCIYKRVYSEISKFLIMFHLSKNSVSRISISQFRVLDQIDFHLTNESKFIQTWPKTCHRGSHRRQQIAL